ncbi:MAG: DUF1430 domain-containing protein [Yaniella sp.]|uniref:DUF1430 domain-containing protein n=1 Tax=Yaniella sp. TaxID=2773929 RepID=UPI00264764BA|nr:DUF1430 domain-containing protein [Yaniella sp.]MDN5731630.1 DUF1430 domain-containing protein [Yaniella sp.]MDN5816135.1 DUF1430 domain-containing protein [Yaniella sp.]MDN5889713.1 DUF1430 domain-containing protein [Yaniella sp.]MDN6758468.1 DUF1430 domain-containing protein [Yaniella sp.]
MRQHPKNSLKDKPKTRISSSTATLTFAAIAKVVGVVVLVFAMLMTWVTLKESNAREVIIHDWSHTNNYAVFYPRLNGDDLAELQAGGHESKIVEARDLYPLLDQQGAIYVDASDYAPGIPPHPWLPVAPVRVNLNYLEQYPLKDQNGEEVQISPDEHDWVVAIPAQYMDRELEIKKQIQLSRTGGPNFEGAVQGQENMLREPVPSSLKQQRVRIIWTKPSQEFFTFNSTINPDHGNTIVDPIVEIMTSKNSMTIDRLNSITGDMNTALKVRTDGNPKITLNQLKSTLTELRLSDNLQTLVTPQQAMLEEVNYLRSTITWSIITAGAGVLIMLVFGASFISLFCDRLRRKIVVRRLHGHGYFRSYRELIAAIVATWVLSALICLAGSLVNNASSFEQPANLQGPIVELPHLAMILIIVFIVDLLFMTFVVHLVERRNIVRRVKEL